MAEEPQKICEWLDIDLNKLSADDKITLIGEIGDTLRLFAIIWAESKSLHNQLISVFSGCVHFATQRRGVESA
jgi:hypothetical protein